MLDNVLFMLDQFATHSRLSVSGFGAELREAIDDVLDEVKAVHIIKDNHVKRRGGGAFLLVTAHMKVFVIGPAVGETMNEPGITVEREDDRFILGEKSVEISVAQAVGMLGLGLEGHEIDDIDDSDFDGGEMVAEPVHSGEGFEGGNISGASHDDIGFGILVIAGPAPDTDAGGTMFNGLVHGEPLGGGLFAGDNDIDVIAAAQAMICDGKECVGVGWKVDPDDFGFFVDDMIDETWVLMAESVVILAPDMGSEQVIK